MKSKRRRCTRCKCWYEGNDTRTWVYNARDWNPADRRCYTCYLEFLCEMYGRWGRPTFVLNGKAYDEDGAIPPENMPGKEEDVPF